MSLLVLVAVVVVLVALALGRRSDERARPDVGRATKPRKDTLTAALTRGVDAGVITKEQAEALLANERALPSPATPRPPARIPPVLEALGYLGGVFVIVGVVSLLSQFWDEFQTWARVGLLGAVTAALMVAGLLIRDETEPVLWRLRGFLLLLASGALAGFTGLLLVDGFAVKGAPVAFAIGTVVTAQAGVLWWLRDRPAQHLACLGGVIAAVVAGLSWAASALGWEGGPGPIGVALWMIGALWLGASLRRLLPPALVGIALGAAVMLVSGAPMGASWHHAAVLCGLATAGMLTALGIWLDEFLVTGIGVLGTFAYLPLTVNAFFGGTIGVPAVMLVSGLVLLGLTVLLFRRHGSGGGFAGRSTRDVRHA